MGVNIFDKYGIKQVANVYFEALENDYEAGVYKGDIVLYLDTLKVSTIETTAENVAAQGGWGNPRLVSWDYGKEINITLEDALMSLESLRFMLGGSIKKSGPSSKVIVHRTVEVTASTSGVVPLPTGVSNVKAWKDHPIKFINFGSRSNTTSKTAGTRTQIVAQNNQQKAFNGTEILYFNNTAAGIENQLAMQGDRVRIFWDEEVAQDGQAVEVTISPSTFPGTYRVVGDTLIRSEQTGADEPFQFVIEKAKVLSEVTFTLEAQGDPSTFEMQLQVLRDTTGTQMMKLIRYSVNSAATNSGNDIGSLSGS